jgi:hypothetical protein
MRLSALHNNGALLIATLAATATLAVAGGRDQLSKREGLSRNRRARYSGWD